MRMLSIDVGIKNLACVIIEFDPINFTPSIIRSWDVLDLTDRSICEAEFCNDVAVLYGNDNRCLCKKHAKADNRGLIIPKPRDKLKNIKKMKFVDLCEYAIEHKIDVGKGSKKPKKADLYKTVSDMVTSKFFTDIHGLSADKWDLISLGRMLKTKLDAFLKNDGVDIVVDIVCIENQISPIANRMKTIQGMITQYFIMVSDCSIEFISSINKLKELNLDTSSYSERKKHGIILCRNKLNEHNKDWCDFFEKSKKKDDLSDCYLQGLFCIKRMRLPKPDAIEE